jgi:hypothetical protein
MTVECKAVKDNNRIFIKNKAKNRKADKNISHLFRRKKITIFHNKSK